MTNLITFENYIEVLNKVEVETGKQLESDAHTVEYFESSLYEYNKQLENEDTEMMYLEWLVLEVTNYVLYDI